MEKPVIYAVWARGRWRRCLAAWAMLTLNSVQWMFSIYTSFIFYISDTVYTLENECVREDVWLYAHQLCICDVFKCFVLIIKFFLIFAGLFFTGCKKCRTKSVTVERERVCEAIVTIMNILCPCHFPHCHFHLNLQHDFSLPALIKKKKKTQNTTLHSYCLFFTISVWIFSVNQLKMSFYIS